MIGEVKTGPVYVLWWPENEPHGHQRLYSTPGERIRLTGTEIEEIATELAEAVIACNQERHEGHGRTHSTEAAMEAFRAAMLQLQTKDYDAEWNDHKKKVAFYKLWGGPPPAAVLMFDPDGNPMLEVTDQQTGMPSFYKVRREAADILLAPSEKNGQVRDKLGLSWLQKPNNRALRRLR